MAAVRPSLIETSPFSIGVVTLTYPMSIPNMKIIHKYVWPVERTQEISADAAAADAAA